MNILEAKDAISDLVSDDQIYRGLSEEQLAKLEIILEAFGEYKYQQGFKIATDIYI